MPADLNIKKGDFYCHSHLLLLLLSSWFNFAIKLWNFMGTTSTPMYLCLATTHLEMMGIIFFYTIPIIVRLILK